MKHRMISLIVLGLLFAAAPALAQNTQIKGSLKGTDGKPIVDAQIDMVNSVNGVKIHLKTDKKGEFFSLGVIPGNYNITFTKDGKPLWKMDNFPITLAKDVNLIDVDLAKEAAASKGQMTEEQKKQVEAVQKTNTTIKE